MEAIPKIAARVSFALRFLLAGIFLFAGAAKLQNPLDFAEQLQHLGFPNSILTPALACYLPFLELICGGALLFRRVSLGALAISIALLLAFEAVLVHALLAGIQASCGCFGKFFGGTSIPLALIRNLVLLAAAMTACAIESASWQESRLPACPAT